MKTVIDLGIEQFLEAKKYSHWYNQVITDDALGMKIPAGSLKALKNAVIILMNLFCFCFCFCFRFRFLASIKVPCLCD